jgi:hypothetical protein
MCEVLVALSSPLPLDLSIPREWVLIVAFGMLIFGRRIYWVFRGKRHD